MKTIITTLAVLICATLAAQKNLYDFGATGNKNLNETAIIQAALNASAGKTLVIPDDTFYVRNLYGVSDLQLIKQGNGCLMYYNNTPSTNGWILQFNGKNNFTIDGLIFDGQYPAVFGSLLQIIGCKDFVVKNSVFQNNFGEGIALKTSANAKLLNNRELFTDVGILTVGGCNNIDITDNYAEGGTSDGIAIWGQNFANKDSNIHISNCKSINKTQGNGFLVQYASNIEIDHNYAYNCIFGIASDDVDEPACSIKVTNNKLVKNQYGIGGVFNKSLITDNFIDSSVTYGMWIGSNSMRTVVTGATIRGNIIRNSQTGLMVGLGSKCIIEKNTISDTRISKNTYAGITLNQGGNHLVRGNWVQAATFPVLVFKSNENTITDNWGRLTDQGLRNIKKDNR